MPYLRRSQIPELSGFSRTQQQFLWKAASQLMYRDDPWFGPGLFWLTAGSAGLAVIIASQVIQWFQGSNGVIAAFSTLAAILVFILLSYTHLLASHMRQFLRVAIERNAKALDGME